MVPDALSESWPDALERGVAGAAIEGEERSGDLAVFAGYDGGALAAVIDGLGHGDAAADAAEVGVGDDPPLSPRARRRRCCGAATPRCARRAAR